MMDKEKMSRVAKAADEFAQALEAIEGEALTEDQTEAMQSIGTIMDLHDIIEAFGGV